MLWEGYVFLHHDEALGKYHWTEETHPRSSCTPSGGMRLSQDPCQASIPTPLPTSSVSANPTGSPLHLLDLMRNFLVIWLHSDECEETAAWGVGGICERETQEVPAFPWNMGSSCSENPTASKSPEQDPLLLPSRRSFSTPYRTTPHLVSITVIESWFY